MGVFDDLVSDIFADTDFTLAATYTPKAGGDPLSLTVGLVDPDETFRAFDTAMTLESVIAEVPIAVLATCGRGDQLVIQFPTGAETFKLGNVRRDKDRTCWVLDLERQP